MVTVLRELTSGYTISFFVRFEPGRAVTERAGIN
jgi:hypothetical protein